MPLSRSLPKIAAQGGVAIGLIGHSYLDQALQYRADGNGNIVSASAAGRFWPAFVSMQTRGRYKFPTSCKFAVSGCTSNDVVNTPLPATYTVAGAGTLANDPRFVGLTQLAAAVACPAPIIAVHAYHNDPAGNLTLAQSIANYTRIVQTLTAAGKRVLLCIDLPSGNVGATAYRWNTLGSGFLARALAFRKWCLTAAPALAPGFVSVVDLYVVLHDPSAGTAQGPSGAQAGDTLYTAPGGAAGALNPMVDGVHANAWGGWLCARAVLPALNAFVEPYLAPARYVTGDVYDATNTPYGTIALASNFDGAGAIPAIGTGVTATGPKPTGWNILTDGSFGTGSPNLTIAASYVRSPDGANYWYQLNFSGTTWSTTSATSYPYLWLQPLNQWPNCMSVGDVLTSSVDFEVDAGGVGFCGLAQYVQSYRPDFNYGWYSGLNTNAGNWDNILSSSIGGGLFAGTLTPDYGLRPYNGQETGMTCGLYVQMMPGASVNFTLRVGRYSVHKVSPASLLA